MISTRTCISIVILLALSALMVNSEVQNVSVDVMPSRSINICQGENAIITCVTVGSTTISWSGLDPPGTIGHQLEFASDFPVGLRRTVHINENTTAVATLTNKYIDHDESQILESKLRLTMLYEDLTVTCNTHQYGRSESIDIIIDSEGECNNGFGSTQNFTVTTPKHYTSVPAATLFVYTSSGLSSHFINLRWWWIILLIIVMHRQ